VLTVRNVLPSVFAIGKVVSEKRLVACVVGTKWDVQFDILFIYVYLMLHACPVCLLYLLAECYTI
jgi:hypothetical protein